MGAGERRLVHHQDTKSTKERQVEGRVLLAELVGPSWRWGGNQLGIEGTEECRIPNDE
jgi:hypothetical protein